MTTPLAVKLTVADGTNSENIAEALRLALGEFVVEAAADEAELPSNWAAVLCSEGVETSDKRCLAEGSMSWRELPLTLAYQPENAPGHDGAVPVGTIERVERLGNRIMAYGTFDLESEAGQEVARLVRDEIVRGISIDAAASEIDYDEDTGVMTVLKGEIMGATVCMHAAFADAVIVPDGAGASLAASALPLSEDFTPPADWFAAPTFDGPTHLTVTDDGRVYGHLALWNTEHIAFPGASVQPPKSRSLYAYFCTGSTDTSTGTARTGPLTLGGGHAPLAATARVAQEHYDNVGTAVADVAAGEDQYGIWVAGSMRIGTTERQRKQLAASDISGDWRTIGGSLELVAVLAVNTAGFPVPVRASAALDGETPLALVAAGMLHQTDERVLAQRVELLEANIEALLEDRNRGLVAALKASVHEGV